MYKAAIVLNTDDDSWDAIVEFNFTEGCPAYITGLPENCYPAEPDEYEIVSLIAYDDVGCEYDISHLIDNHFGEIEDQLNNIDFMGE